MEKINKYGDGSNNKELVITDKFGNVKSIFQKKITLTTTGSTGPATFVNNILNIPEYSSALTGYVPNSRQLTINGTTYDLSANRTWNVGTVTSVGISMPSAFTVASSPITSSGTIAITGAGTTAEYIDGTGALRPFPSLTGYVPYIGATQDVDLGVHQLKADSLAISTTSTEPVSIGEIVWNSIDGTFDMGLLNGVTLQAGQEMHFYAKADEAITNGDAVQFAGAQGDHLLIKKAVPSEINANPEYFVGVATQDFARNQFGYVTAFGKVRDLNTLAYPEGTILYFASGGSTPGALTATEPSAPNAKILVAAVVRSHGTQGTLLVRPHVMPKIEKLQDVNVTGVTSGQVLTYNGSIWVPTTPTTGTVTSVTASAPLSSSGGSTPNITISQASGTDDGYLSSADWSTFNSKQPAGNYITALSGEATGSGPGTAAVTLNNASVTAKVLTGVNITGGSISASDSILTAFGKLQNQINGLIGSSVYQGTWNASTNTPALASGVGTRGYYYIVNVAGSTNLDGITDWNVGDWAIFDGTAWQQVDNTDSVTSVNGQTGAVSLTTDNIPEGATNLYFTQLRARQSITLTTSGSSGAATYNNGTGALNIPNYTLSGLGGVPSSRRLEINGISYDLSADRSWSVGTVTSIATSGPLTGGTITGSGTIGITQATPFTDGYLSYYDWNTFNNKQDAITLTTTGTSGPATLIGSTLNIPQYQSVITNPVTGTGTTNYVARWTSSSNISTGVLYDNGTNVGIATTNPLNTLQVGSVGSTGYNSNNIAWGDGTRAGAIYINSNASYLYASGDQILAPGSGEKVRITSGGNVGIGTSSPTAKLHVWNDKIEVTGFPSAGNPFTFLESNYNDQSAVAIKFLNYNPSNGFDSDLGIQLMNTGGSMFDAMIIKGSTGNLGIGTNTPSQKLEVNGNIKLSSTVGATSTPSYIWLGNDHSNGTTRDKLKIYLYNAGTEQYGFTVGGSADIQYHSNAIHDFYIANSHAVRINSSANVGIGTTNPTQKLSVIGNVYANGGFIGYRLDGGIGLEVNGGDLGPGSFIAKFNDYNNTSKVVILGNGNVGIGTTNPGVKLEVSGQAFVDKFQYNQAIQISGADLNGVTTAGFYAGSGLTNAPDNNGWYWVTVERHSDSGWVHQLATSYGAGNTENLMYSRVKMNNSTWTTWKKISYSTDTPTATSVYDLLPNARVDYTWVGQVVNGSWVDIFTRANNVLTSGTWIVNMYVTDYSTGGEHYTYTYSGTFTWFQNDTNQSGTPSASEIALHRMGHAANSTVLYLRTKEETAADGGNGRFQISGNYSHFANTTINFKFVKII
jgi:hypothetical protein